MNRNTVFTCFLALLLVIACLGTRALSVGTSPVHVSSETDGYFKEYGTASTSRRDAIEEALTETLEYALREDPAENAENILEILRGLAGADLARTLPLLQIVEESFRYHSRSTCVNIAGQIAELEEITDGARQYTPADETEKLPEDPDLLSAVSLLETGNHEQALLNLAKALKNAGAKGINSGELVSAIHHFTGKAQQALSRYGQAIEGYRSSVKAEEKCPWARRSLLSLGGVYRIIGNTEEAERSYSTLVRNFSGHPDALRGILGIGDCRLQMGDPEDAAGYYSRALMEGTDPKIAKEAKKGLRAAATMSVAGPGLMSGEETVICRYYNGVSGRKTSPKVMNLPGVTVTVLGIDGVPSAPHIYSETVDFVAGDYYHIDYRAQAVGTSPQSGTMRLRYVYTGGETEDRTEPFTKNHVVHEALKHEISIEKTGGQYILTLLVKCDSAESYPVYVGGTGLPHKFTEEDWTVSINGVETQAGAHEVNQDSTPATEKWISRVKVPAGENDTEIRVTFGSTYLYAKPRKNWEKGLVTVKVSGGISSGYSSGNTLGAGHDIPIQRGVNLYSGNHFIRETDINVPSLGLGLNLVRTYNSLGIRNVQILPRALYAFGAGWTHGYACALLENGGGLVFVDGDGARLPLEKTGENTWKSPAGKHFTVKNTGGAFVLEGKTGEIYRFGKDGLLEKIEDRNGNFIEIIYTELSGKTEEAYGENGRAVRIIEKIRDRFGREIVFEHDSATGMITAAVDPLGRRTTFQYEKKYFLSSMTGPGGYTVKYTWTSDGMMNSRTLPNGYTEEFGYSKEGRLIARTNSFGEEKFAYNTGKGETAMEDRLSRTSRFSMDAKGRLTGKITPLENVYTTDWNEDNLVSALCDPLGKSRIHTYDSLGNITNIKDRTGAETILQWNGKYSVPTKLADPEGNITTIDLDERGNPVHITDPCKGETVVEYGQIPGYPTLVTDAMGGKTQITWDSFGYVSGITDPAGAKTGFIHDRVGRLLAKTAPNGGITTYSWDEQDRLVSVKYPDQGSGIFEYDQMGYLTGYTDQEGNRTVVSRDLQGRPVQVVNPLGQITVHGYDAEGNLVQITDPAGRTRVVSHNGEDRPDSWINPDSSETSLEYDPAGRVKAITNGLSRTWKYDVDAEGRVTGEKDPLEGTKISSYTPSGLLSGVTDSLNHFMKYAYDGAGRVREITDPAGKTTIVRDLLGRITGKKDPLGNVEKYGLDAAGRLVSVTGAMGNITCCEWDGMGNPVKITDARGNARLLEYDIMGRLVRDTDPMGLSTEYVYDRKGALRKKLKANGETTVYLRDPLGRVTQITYPDRTVTLTYDPSGNLGKIASTAPEMSIVREYDRMDRVTKETISPHGLFVEYAYDAAGNRTLTRTAGGAETQYVYDECDRIKKIISGSETFEYTHDITGRRTALFAPNGVLTEYGYDKAGRLASVHAKKGSQTILSRVLTRDATGNILGISGPEGESHFAYDASSRLIRGEYPDGALEQFQYDINGNRTGQTGAGITPVTYEYDRANRLISALCENERTDYEWDSAGNLLVRTVTGKDGVTQRDRYIWDSEDRLLGADVYTDETAEIRFAYDPRGRRISRRVNDEATYFQHDGNDVIAGYASDIDLKAGRRALTLKERYIHGLGIDEHLAMISFESETGTQSGSPRTPKNGEAIYFHQDERGSVLGVTDSTGQIVGRWTERAFGQRLASQSFNSPYGFTGREYEEELGLSFHRARFYDPSIGRFISRDPVFGNIGNPISQHPYVYGNLSPYRYTDPKGEFVFLIPALYTMAVAWSSAMATDMPGFQADMTQMANDFSDPKATTTDKVISVLGLATPILTTSVMKGVLTGADEVVEGISKVVGKSDETIRLYHGSISNYSEIVEKGLSHKKVPTWITTSKEAAENAIGVNRVINPGQGMDRGVIESIVPIEQFEKLIELDKISPTRTWPGFGGGKIYPENVLRKPEAIELFNQGIVRP